MWSEVVKELDSTQMLRPDRERVRRIRATKIVMSTSLYVKPDVVNARKVDSSRNVLDRCCVNDVDREAVCGTWQLRQGEARVIAPVGLMIPTGSFA